jgi:hypothetical protein
MTNEKKTKEAFPISYSKLQPNLKKLLPAKNKRKKKGNK